MDGLKTLELDSKRQADLQKELTALQEKLKDYKEKNNLTERPMETVENTDQMHEKLSLLRKQLTACDKRIEETEREVEQLPETENELERAEETLKLYKDKHQCISDTVQLLKEAEKNLKDRYIAPIKEKFSFYAEALERVLDEKVTMDSDYRVTFERGGEARVDKHLSMGERSLCALCLRLALIDNMYPAEQPFIVMDDPFIHLDEEHMERTVALMQELSKTRQIIYFCCHESRSVTRKI
jgi:DNA repair exonuclease SbcCD ATPase subunit